MPHGSQHDETGWLNQQRGQLVLHRDLGGTWVLDTGFRTSWRARRLLGKRVRVQGVRDDFNLLAVSALEAE